MLSKQKMDEKKFKRWTKKTKERKQREYEERKASDKAEQEQKDQLEDSDVETGDAEALLEIPEDNKCKKLKNIVRMISANL